MKYIIDLSADEPIMLIDEEIGATPDGRGIIGSDFAEALLWLGTIGKKRIRLFINSPGGNVMDGFSIYNAIIKNETPVDTYNVGIAASVAGWLFGAGATRYMNDYAKIMMHNPSNDDGSKDKGLSEIKHSICVAIAARCHKTEDEVSKMMSKETWLNADEAKEIGLCDVIEKSTDVNKIKITANDVRGAWNQARKVLEIHKKKVLI